MGVSNNMNISLKIVYGMVLSAALYACSSDNMLSSTVDAVRGAISYSPCQREDGDKWGLVDLQGNFIADGMFDNMPTNVVFDHFFVMDKDSLYTLYTISPTVKYVNDRKYQDVGFFSCGLCPVVTLDGHIEYIRYDGSTAINLSTLDGIDITEAGVFHDERAVIVSDKGVGFIDTEGNLVKNTWYMSVMNYSEGKAVVMGLGQEGLHPADRRESIINKDGISIFTMPRFRHPLDGFREGLLPAHQRTEPGVFYLYNEKGEETVVLNCDSFNPVSNGKFAFTMLIKGKDGTIKHKWGLMDITGNIMAEPKYDHISDNGHVYIGYSNKSVWLINEKGEKIKRLDASRTSLHREAYKDYDKSIILIDSAGYGRFADAMGNVIKPDLKLKHIEQNIQNMVCSE